MIARAAAGTGAMGAARQAMIERIRAYGLLDPFVLGAMGRVRREAFFPGGAPEPEIAYGDFPCAIGHGATISQPFIVAYMTHRLDIRAGDRALEIGTGSGYQAALLAALGACMWTLEIVPQLAEHARSALAREGFGDVQVRCAGGCDAWRDAGPFNAIMATCAPKAVPAALLDQLAEGGRMILPCGPDADSQRLVFIRRLDGEIVVEDDMPVRFVPMIESIG